MLRARVISTVSALRLVRGAGVVVRNYSSSHNNIPEIDFRDFDSSTINQREIIAQIRTACSRTGFMYVKNVPGLPQELISKCLDYTARFFSMPQSEKNNIHTSASNMRGYYKFTGSGAVATDNIEAYLMGNDVLSVSDLRREYYRIIASNHNATNWESMSFNQPNQWPKDQGFKEAMLEYWNGCCIASATILRALAMTLGLPSHHFVNMHLKHDCTMELKNYPPVQQQQFHTRLPPHLRGLRIPKVSSLSSPTSDAEVDHHRFNEHSDLSSITLLIQTNNIDCLEVKDRANNEWIKASAHPGMVLVNTGDVIERWTNGVYPSTRHRVVTNKDQTTNRYSVVFFCMPDWETDMSPIDPSVEKLNTPNMFGDLIPFS